MSERLPYEEQLPQHLRDFPLPDENAAWADMKRRLDEDEDNGAIVWWRKGCALWAGLLLIAALLITGWWFFNREKNDRVASGQTINDRPVADDVKTRDKDTSLHGSPKLQTEILPRVDTISSARKRNAAINKWEQQQKEAVSSAEINASGETASPTEVNRKKIADPAPVKGKAKVLQAPAKKPTPDTAITRSDLPLEVLSNPTTDSIRRFIAGDPQIRQPQTVAASSPTLPLDSIRAFVTGDTIVQQNNDSTVLSRQHWPIDSIKAFVKGDTATNRSNDAVALKTDSLPSVDSSIKKTDTTETAYFLSAGIALTQQLPIAGQKAVPYASQGREFSLADYIPSVYFRFNKKDRWFVQGEFRYGAPQYTKPITYSILTDTNGTAPIARTEKTLQKTYYHQLPVSFNYYLTRNWALGAGLVWNRFSKSVFEEDQLQRDPLNPFDTFHVKETMVSKDAAKEGLSSSYFQGLIESQYQWKKFSFGARYTFGLTPYLRFTLPGEAERRERNQSLQFFIRYNLWTKSLK
ncbi:PorT family protein [Terrimonas sp. NA20]|uniref:PorT family protein n=1 Tax=Terrimonas ginsenosidimutans TaxID=2908004 RepID=A0ABS9KZ91_9BACT|nr:PorT family protein [Terrimonas ginsenosidimutans]MCG2617628.1 PorT family protein [Terrimonas ginsenosidimutans]